MESIPSRASDAGPESKDPGYDWRDYLDFAREETIVSSRSMCLNGNVPEARNSRRIQAIDNAIEHLQRAKELLCR